MPVVTISREAGSLGDDIAGLLSRKLNASLITRELVMSGWMPEVANKYELHILEESPKSYLKLAGSGVSFAAFLENRLSEEARKGPAVIIGLGAQVIFANDPDAIHVRITASDEIRINRLMQCYCLNSHEAAKLLELGDRKHKRYISTLYAKDWSDASLYHLTLNTDKMGVEEAAELLLKLVEIRKMQKQTAITPELPLSPVGSEKKQPVFKHPAEEEFAKILDMYNIEWEYEPRTFPVEWDAEGNVTMAFSPDFYLTRFDTYIELTTMDQKYVTRKNKKARRLKELYPGINIRIVYKNDFYSLLKRFGLGATKGDTAE